MSYKLHEGDVCHVLPQLPAESFDACLCDPPYGLEFMGKEWDRLLLKDRNTGYPSCRQHHGPNEYRAGITAQQWHQRWAEAVYRMLKPGAFLLAFGGTRTFHRLTCAIEDAGFEIRDCLMWLYGSGFPKSLDISKALDKAAGAEREVVGTRPGFPGGGRGARPGPKAAFGGGGYKEFGAEVPVTAPATEAAKQWNGWGTALKPAWEPIVVAMKPRDGTFVQNALNHGVGGINVHGCRVEGQAEVPFGVRQSPTNSYSGGWKAQNAGEGMANDWRGSALGRWPANFMLSHHPDCRKRGSKKVKSSNFQGAQTGRVNKVFGKDHRPRSAVGYASPDGTETVDAWDCHPDCPVRMLDKQSGTHGTGKGRRPIYVNAPNKSPAKGKEHPHVTYEIGDSGGASRFFYCAKASRKERNAGCMACVNSHPTVKPLALCKYLATLILPPKRPKNSRHGLRRLLVPFAGSGSEMIAALQAGWDVVEGIEKEAEYAKIARARLEHHAGVRQGVLFEV